MRDAPCTRCGQRAPLVFEGVVSKCSACGAPRNPLTASAVHVTGKARQVGGSVANVLGWLVVAAGAVAALLIGAALQWIFPLGYAGFLAGGLVALVTSFVGVALVVGGRALRRRGDEVARETLHKAIFALADHRGGALTIDEVARSLDIAPQTADAVLTDLAKQPDAHVGLDVSDDGTLVYSFSDRPRARVRTSSEPRRVRIAEPAAGSRDDASPEDVDAESAEARRATQSASDLRR